MTGTAAPVHWGEQLRWREKVHERYPNLWDLKIVRKRLPFVLKYLRDGEGVLEVGAFDRSMEGRLKQFRPQILYKSLDIDRTVRHDYTSLDEVHEKFDLVLLFELIEHLDGKNGREMIAKIFNVLSPGGRVIVTTPNVYTPGQYWKDASHLTPYHYEELGGMFLSERFELLEICRMFSAPMVQYAARVYLFGWVFHLLGIDFTKSIILAVRKA